MATATSAAGEPALQVLIYHPIQHIWFYLLAAAVLLALAVYTRAGRTMGKAFSII